MSCELCHPEEPLATKDLEYIHVHVPETLRYRSE